MTIDEKLNIIAKKVEQLDIEARSAYRYEMLHDRFGDHSWCRTDTKNMPTAMFQCAICASTLEFTSTNSYTFYYSKTAIKINDNYFLYPCKDL